MFDPITLGVGGALAIAGWFTGRAGRRPRLAPTPAGAVCSCTHGYGIHRDGLKCGAQVQRASEWDSVGNDVGYEWVPCPCQSYDGPEPLPRVWTLPGGSS